MHPLHAAPRDVLALRNRLWAISLFMGTPTNAVTLTPEQVAELNRKLSRMRHDINNHLSLIIAAAELLRIKPEVREKMATTLSAQAPRITDEIAAFSAEFEKTFGITRD